MGRGAPRTQQLNVFSTAPVPGQELLKVPWFMCLLHHFQWHFGVTPIDPENSYPAFWVFWMATNPGSAAQRNYTARVCAFWAPGSPRIQDSHCPGPVCFQDPGSPRIQAVPGSQLPWACVLPGSRLSQDPSCPGPVHSQDPGCSRDMLSFAWVFPGRPTTACRWRCAEELFE